MELLPPRQERRSSLHRAESAERQFRRMVETYGFPVLLVSMDHDLRCFCFDDDKGYADPHCATCLGTGWTRSLQRHWVVENVAAVPETLPRLIRHHEAGLMPVSARHFYFTSQARPKVQDWVVLTRFDVAGHPISAQMDIYVVHHVATYRIGDGRILAYQASASQDIVDTPIKSAFLRGDAYWPRYR